MQIDNNLVGSLLKALRGNISQGQLNQKFRFKSNTVAKWERGNSRITWQDFLKFALYCKVDVYKITQNYFHFYSDVSDQSLFMAFIFGKKSTANIAKLSNISQMKITRILKGTAPLFLVDFLKILDGTGHLICKSYLSQIIDLEIILPQIDSNSFQKSLIHFTYNFPESASIFTALTMPQFKNVTKNSLKKLAIETGVPLQRLTFLIEKMIELKFMTWEKNKLILIGQGQADDRGSIEGTLRVRKFWLERAVEIAGNTEQFQSDERDVFGSVVFATNKEARQKIISLYLRFFEDMKKVVLENEDKSEMIQVLSFQLFNPKHIPKD